jgi:hypothetical protein
MIMKSIKIIGIFGLITGIAGLSHAGVSEKSESEAFQGLEKSRTGLVAYAPSSVQWGDSPEVLNKICNIYVDDNYYNSAFDNGSVSFRDQSGRNITLGLYPGVGVYSVCIQLFSKKTTPEQLIEKYTKEYGTPAKEEKRGFGGVLDAVIYRWDAKTHIVEIVLPAFESPTMLNVNLTRLELLKEVEALQQKKKNATEEKKKAETQKLLDF